ncbi:polysaccharide lyase family 8 protein [Tulasnella calospora MUT 4182]|uniref:Polysaccharide lyase family 8 protein n=1 Tax=Tulasnella calospora MUT 4182 TaxID=1051891 RepID=A0A0C3Q9C5_9AGAM|nr:polysaccharide lyase family 8 protein [Tulasnella calospora MUT 4182]
MTSKLKLSSFLLGALSASVRAADNAADLQTLYKQRIPFIVQTYPVTGGEQQLSAWVNTLSSTGQWPDVNYTTGCPAQRANWPAQGHWLHAIPLAAAYTDVLPHSANITEKPPYDFVGNETVATALDSAMDYWFSNDFTNNDCIDMGGLTNATCVCGTPGLWNTNWYSNVILIPRQAVQTVLLLNKTVTPEQRSAAVHMVERGATTFGRWVNGLGFITGANTLDISSNLVNAGIAQALAGNSTGYDLIAGAFQRVHNEVVVQTTVKADGIRPDGSFGQHVGILYNGNYGKDYANLVLSLEIPAAGTQWAANATSQTAFSKHIDGSAWMVYRNTKTGVAHWDVSTIGRFISFAVSDLQATASLNMNFTQVLQLGQQWKDANMTRVATSLLKNGTTSNAGNLVGNRMFHDNDYMVQRGKNYVTSLKLLSSRTSNTECVNSQNPFGFHLGQGNLFNYGSGNEYEDIAAAWDWNLIPGTTTDYGATPLLCNFTQWSGNRTFVGGASNGKVGVAAMDYLNPYTGAFAYRKAWFFLPNDVQHVIVSDIVKSSNATDVFHVLDQKRANGKVYVDGVAAASPKAGAKSLWHDSVGYTFNTASSSAIKSVQFATPERSGNWKTIGTSAAPPINVSIFQAWLQHDASKLSTPISYSIYPDTSSAKTFTAKAQKYAVKSISQKDVSAAVDSAKSVLMAVFWNAAKLKADLGIGKSVSVQTSAAAVVMVDLKTWSLTVSDPSQTLTKVDVTVQATAVTNYKCAGLLKGKKVTVQLPQGADLGKSTFKSLC